MRLPGLGGWREDPLWAGFYDWSVEHPTLGGMLWRLGIDSDLGRLYDATAEIGRQPEGSSILDIPCGGGVALRGLRPHQGVRYVAADIAPTMLARTRDAAAERGVADQLETVQADVTALRFADGEFDLVVSFTGLHCFPDPRAAVHEMARVVAHGGVLSGSALVHRPGLAGARDLPLWTAGRLAGLLGPGTTADQIAGWLAEAGLSEVEVGLSGAIGYFHAVRR